MFYIYLIEKTLNLYHCFIWALYNYALFISAQLHSGGEIINCKPGDDVSCQFGASSLSSMSTLTVITSFSSVGVFPVEEPRSGKNPNNQKEDKAVSKQ